MKFVIIAPHPDDELIGCFTLFQKRLVKKVYYILSDLKRRVNAEILGKEWGFSTEFLTFDEFFKKKLVFQFDEICLVPDILDRHPLHKAVSVISKAKNYPLGYYTTEMNTGYVRELTKKDQKLKKKMLDKYYPTEKSLWQYDWKYFLFEGITLDLLSYDLHFAPTSCKK
uniref:PIG-L family deacetylase n=1 Tax=Dictyoglomus turgidum TaxID=513050 RepID=A0A7C3WMV8_9BACT